MIIARCCCLPTIEKKFTACRGGGPANAQEQAMMTMMLLQLLMGLQAQEAPDVPSGVVSPMVDGGQRI